MKFLSLSKSKICDYYLYVFLLFTFFLFTKFISNSAWEVKILLNSSFYLEALLVISIFVLLYLIGDAIRKLLKFKTVSSGIVGFLVITFFINVLFSFFKISSVLFEIWVLVVVVSIALIKRFFTLLSLKKKIFYIGLLALIFIVFKFLPKVAFIVKDHRLGDVNWFWYPISFKYFQEGFLSAFIGSNIKGYGLFVHHVWVVIKRFVSINSYSIDAFHFMPKVLFFVGVLFIQELRISKIIKNISSLVFIFFTLSHAWITQLLFNSLMGEGVTALCFAIMFNEVLENRKNNELSIRFLFSWLIMGLLYITKPFISYLVLLTPFILICNFFDINNNKLIIFRNFIIALVLSFSGYFIWKMLNTSYNFSSNAYSVGLPTKFGFSSDLLAIKFCLNDRLATLFFLIGFGSVFLGTFISKLKNIFINIPILFVVLNFALVLALYATFWLGYSDVESAYRYFLQIFYVAFLGFVFSLQVIGEESSFLKAKK
ncbi:MAG: hypothetical protein GY830_02570 [Bacteroidetes bacterium]|nr:hypothetical protein [Bacteroidota bacterium]